VCLTDWSETLSICGLMICALAACRWALFYFRLRFGSVAMRLVDLEASPAREHVPGMVRPTGDHARSLFIDGSAQFSGSRGSRYLGDF
jgi:hypothetical protein